MAFGIPAVEVAKISLACRGFSSVAAAELRRRIEWMVIELDLDGGKVNSSSSSNSDSSSSGRSSSSSDLNGDIDIVTGGSSGNARENLRKLLGKWPRALDCDPIKALAPRTAYFRSLGLLPADLRRLALSAPQLLGGLSLRGVIMPRVEALRKAAALDGAGVSRVIARAPTVLLAAPSAVAERAKLVADVCSLDRNQLARAVAGHPALLEYSVDSLAARLDFLRLEAGLRPPMLGDVLSRAPSLLSLDVERNLRPKWRFLVRTTQQATESGGGGGKSSGGGRGSKSSSVDAGRGAAADDGSEGARKLLARCPVYLTLSLERRILPRVAFLEAVRAQREGNGRGGRQAKREKEASRAAGAAAAAGEAGKKPPKQQRRAGAGAAPAAAGSEFGSEKLPLPPMVVALASASATAGIELPPSSRPPPTAAEPVSVAAAKRKKNRKTERGAESAAAAAVAVVEESSSKANSPPSSSSSPSVLPVSYLTWSDAMFAERGARTALSDYEEFKERVVAALAGSPPPLPPSGLRCCHRRCCFAVVGVGVVGGVGGVGACPLRERKQTPLLSLLLLHLLLCKN